MSKLQESPTEFSPITPIRVETALSRYPVHRLAKHGNIAIDIRETNASGEVSIKWTVTYNSGFGQPGPLAYKLDTLLINRRIEESYRPIQKIIKIGSLNDICRHLELAESGKNTSHIKNSFHQNASAYITAKIRYKTIAGTDRTIEFGDTRYAVVFTGEQLPDGRTADAVYIVLHDFYREILDKSITRPLDYDYLKSLPPAPQRFYELLSYQMYAAIKNDRARAKLLYSELCTYAPLTRHIEWERVRSQLTKIHAPHKASGYITKIDFEQTVDSDGIPDWIMLYQPGPKARAEYRAFTKRGGPVMHEMEPFGTSSPQQVAAPEPLPPLVAELTGHGVTEAMARQLVNDYDEDKIRHQIEILGWLEAKKPGKISDSAAWLVIAIKNGHATPKGFVSAAERARQAEAKRKKEEDAAASRRHQREQEAAERALAAQVAAYRKSATPEQLARLEKDAVAQASEDIRKNLDDAAMKPFRKTLLTRMVNDHIARLIEAGQLSVAPA